MYRFAKPLLREATDVVDDEDDDDDTAEMADERLRSDAAFLANILRVVEDFVLEKILSSWWRGRGIKAKRKANKSHEAAALIICSGNAGILDRRRTIKCSSKSQPITSCEYCNTMVSTRRKSEPFNSFT